MIAVTLIAMTGLGVLLAAAALLLERACIKLAVPRRWTWLTAMILMCLVPLLPAGLASRVPVSEKADGVDASALTIAEKGVSAMSVSGTYFRTDAVRRSSPVEQFVTVAVERLGVLDGPLLILWLLASLVLLSLTIRSARRLTQMQRSWIRRQRDGLTTPAVWVSEDIGPAAFGAGRGAIVIPRWAMHLPPLDRRLLLLHERSHVEARDPRLLAFGMALVILLPWHAPLRWCFRRLQRAIEHDCDRRVLHRPSLSRRYAELLLHVAERGIAAPAWQQRALATGGASVSMTSLLNGQRDLEARLRALAPAVVTGRSFVHAIATVAPAVALLLAACAVPMPRRVTPSAQPLISRDTWIGNVARDPRWITRSGGANAGATARNYSDSLYFARNDSLVIAAIAQSELTLLNLAATETPFVAIALSETNEVVAHSIRAGTPVQDTTDTITAAARSERAAVMAGLPPSARNDAEFAGQMELLANNPDGILDSLGITHLQVGTQPLTVLWVRFKQRGRS